MNFPEIGPAHAPEIESSKKYWISFPEIRLCHNPETEILEKFLDEFSRTCQWELNGLFEHVAVHLHALGPPTFDVSVHK